MKKIMIITADNCDDSELLYPLYRVQEAGLIPEIVSNTLGTLSAKYHFKATIDKTFKDVNLSDYDGLILPGGNAPEKLRQNDNVIKIVKHFFNSRKPIASICHGQQILISASVLNGVKATCYPGIADDLKNCGAIYCDMPVVVDSNIITSRTPKDLPYFMREFLKLM